MMSSRPRPDTPIMRTYGGSGRHALATTTDDALKGSPDDVRKVLRRNGIAVYMDSLFVDPKYRPRHATIGDRLEYLRGEIDAERISWSELAELQGLAEHIDDGDVQLREWAGIPE